MKRVIELFCLLLAAPLCAQPAWPRKFNRCDTLFTRQDTIVCMVNYESSALARFYRGKKLLFLRNYYRRYNGEVYWETKKAGLFDQLQGEACVLYPNGKTKILTRYEHGKMEGPYRVFFPNGRLGYEAHYHRGNLEGDERLYYKNGQLANHRIYKHGRLRHVIGVFDAEGHALEIGDFQNGNGHLLNYNNKGERIGIFYFKHGKLKRAKRNKALQPREELPVEAPEE